MARVETRSQPEGDGSSERDGGLIVACELVVSGRNASEVLEAAEHGLDEPAVPVTALVVLDRPLPVAPAGDDWVRALIAQL